MNIDPVEDAYLKMRQATAMTTPICDKRGPLVYEVSSEPSLNGVNPDCAGEPNASEEDDGE